MRWSKKYDRCLSCGTQSHKHVARGLCVYCYRSDIEKRHKSPISERLKVRKIFATNSIYELEFQYENLKMPLSDLARKYNCSRQYIYKLLKEFEIKRRDKAAAREIALSREKIVFDREGDHGGKFKVTLQKNVVNKDFFKSWSPAMAYVLGVIYTDGNLQPGILKAPQAKTTIRTARFSVSQKDPELLLKVLALMGSNSKLYFSKKRGIAGVVYYFHINDDEIYEDLLRLGLKPNKSLSLDFPQVPEPYARHFIRGCWDGDGSVYLEEDNLDDPRASFVSGSRHFAEGILKQLVSLGLSEQKLYTAKSGRAFYFRFRNAADCTKLYHVFYDEVPESMYLSRKFELFKAIGDKFKGRLAIPHALAFLDPLVFPEPLNRSIIARILGIGPRQVTLIMKPPLLRAELQKLSDKADQATIQKIRKEVHAALRRKAARQPD